MDQLFSEENTDVMSWKILKVEKSKVETLSFILQPKSLKSVENRKSTVQMKFATFLCLGSFRTANIQVAERVHWSVQTKELPKNTLMLQTSNGPYSFVSARIWMILVAKWRWEFLLWLFSTFQIFHDTTLLHFCKNKRSTTVDRLFLQSCTKIHLVFPNDGCRRIQISFSETSQSDGKFHQFWCNMVVYYSDRTLSLKWLSMFYSPDTLTSESRNTIEAGNECFRIR